MKLNKFDKIEVKLLDNSKLPQENHKVSFTRSTPLIDDGSIMGIAMQETKKGDLVRFCTNGTFVVSGC